MPVAPTPHPKGKRPPAIKRLPITGWDSDGNFTITIKVNKEPKASASRKCYMFAFEHGEIDKVVSIGGKDRKVRMTFMLYVKVPSTERRATLLEESKQAALSGHPELY